MGALVFSLYAMTESYQVLGMKDDRLLEFFARRGGWLLRHNESGQLANHQALAALALQNVFAVTADARFQAGKNRFRDLTFSWQHDEGWFQEYEGADPGYHSCSIDFLAKLRQKTADARLTEPLRKAVHFAAHFMHPDGSYAGEYGSRNTYHFYPHGFELLAQESPEALQIAELYLRKGLPMRTRYVNDDNRMCAHYVYDWFQAWRDYAEVAGRSTQPCLTEPKTVYLSGARLLVKRDERACTIVAANKGVIIKVTNQHGPVHSDTGPLVQFASGPALVAHLVAPDNQVDWRPAEGVLVVAGQLCRRRAPIMTPLKQIVFRLLSLTLGRLNPNWLRILIQKIFITGKPVIAATFRRTFRFQADGIEVTDEIDLKDFGGEPRAVLLSPDSTSIYVANSNTYQATNLLPLRRLDQLLAGLRQSRFGKETWRIEYPATSRDHP